MRAQASAILVVLAALTSCRAGCQCAPTPPTGDASPVPPSGGGAAALVLANTTTSPTTVYVAFGSDSVVTSWPVCVPNPSGCAFPLAAGASQGLPLGGAYLNATFAFGAQVGCGSTKAEANMNNPAWSNDTADVSLVDGYNAKVRIDLMGADGGVTTLGPPVGKTGNEQVYGVFPYGCDVCVAATPPMSCGIPACGSSPNDGGQGCGCKSGGQYNPTVPCQWSGPKGTTYVISLTP